MTTNVLAAEARAKAGKGAARAVRRQGQVPAVIYGDNKEPVLLSLNEKELVKLATKKGFFTQLCEVTVGKEKFLTIPRDVQVHPVNDRPEHVDFLRVSEKTSVRVSVPLRVTNEKGAPGIAKGGVVNVVYHELEVLAKATSIPTEFVVDLTGLDVGQSLHVDALKLSKDVKPVMPGNFTIVTLVAPSGSKAEEAAPAAAAAAPAAAAKDAKAAAPAKKK